MMKETKFKQSVRQLGMQDLSKKLEELRHELLNLRLNSAPAHVKDYSQFKKLRRDVARVMVIMHQKKLQQEE